MLKRFQVNFSKEKHMKNGWIVFKGTGKQTETVKSACPFPDLLSLTRKKVLLLAHFMRGLEEHRVGKDNVTQIPKWNRTKPRPGTDLPNTPEPPSWRERRSYSCPQTSNGISVGGRRSPGTSLPPNNIFLLTISPYKRSKQYQMLPRIWTDCIPHTLLAGLHSVQLL